MLVMYLRSRIEDPKFSLFLFEISNFCFSNPWTNTERVVASRSWLHARGFTLVASCSWLHARGFTLVASPSWLHPRGFTLVASIINARRSANSLTPSHTQSGRGTEL